MPHSVLCAVVLGPQCHQELRRVLISPTNIHAQRAHLRDQRYQDKVFHCKFHPKIMMHFLPCTNYDAVQWSAVLQE